MSKDKVPASLNWTDDRCQELDALWVLLGEVQSINAGSNCLERIQKCIDLATSLRRTDFGSGRMSFWHFVQDLAIEDRKAADAATGAPQQQEG
jgi:hypothetical protein